MAENNTASTVPPLDPRAWPAVWSLVIGFFMILLDTTIVAVAIEKIMTGLHTDVNSTLWVTSGYLLAYAVPLLVCGRLGDRFGQKRLYVTGLAVFTVASLGCGLSGQIAWLIFWRVVQGLGAAMMTPQTMAIITRLFPPQRRGTALGVWGATAGVATLLGPILGGLLTDWLGWEWIFFVNVPVGIVGILLGLRNIPTLKAHATSFDWLGVGLSAVAMFLIVFGIQESGQSEQAALITASTAVWLIIAGVVVLVGFIIWQYYAGDYGLVPLRLFTDRNFSLANLSISMVGAWVTSFVYPLFLYLQSARGLTPTQSALLIAPQAVLSGALAPWVGRKMNVIDAKWFALLGLALNAVGLFIIAALMSTETPVGWFLLPAVFTGVGNALMWGPLSLSATRNLPPRWAGAGSGVYNTTRQIGAVIGAAAMAALMSSQLSARLQGGSAATPGGAHMPAGTSGTAGGPGMPASVAHDFAQAMATSMLLPAVICSAAIVVVIFFTPVIRRNKR